jgi:hypothetical protein
LRNIHYSIVTSGDNQVRMWPSTNPFAWDVATLSTDSVELGTAEEQQQQLLATADQQNGRPAVSSHFKLPDFWPQAPGLWFARAVCRFEMMNMQDSWQMFCFVTDALPYETMRLVADLVAAPPANEPYKFLKERLMLAHALTPVQKAEKLFSIPQLGGCRPSDMLAAMFEFCPEGEENSALFKALFLTRLPAELRVHLEAAKTAPLKQLALRADQLWMTLVAKQQVLLAAQLPVQEAAVELEEDSLVAAVQRRFGGRRKDKKPPQAAADGGQAPAATGR